MPRSRTNPEAIATIHYDAVTQFGMGIVHGDDMRVIPSQSKFVYVVEHRDANGRKIGQTAEEIAWGDIPAPDKRALKSVFARVIAHAESKGYMGDGTDNDDLP